MEVAILPTVPSTDGFSFISEISDMDDYRRKNVIGDLIQKCPIKAKNWSFSTFFSDNIFLLFSQLISYF